MRLERERPRAQKRGAFSLRQEREHGFLVLPVAHRLHVIAVRHDDDVRARHRARKHLRVAGDGVC